MRKFSREPGSGSRGVAGNLSGVFRGNCVVPKRNQVLVLEHQSGYYCRQGVMRHLPAYKGQCLFQNACVNIAVPWGRAWRRAFLATLSAEKGDTQEPGSGAWRPCLGWRPRGLDGEPLLLPPLLSKEHSRCSECHTRRMLARPAGN